MVTEKYECGLELHWQGQGEDCLARVVSSTGETQHEGTYRSAVAYLAARNIKPAVAGNHPVKPMADY